MEQKPQKFLAFDFERKQLCTVLSIVTSDLNGRILGNVELNNGHVTFLKNYLEKECALLEYTYYQDKDKQDIYQDDLLENDKYIFRVEWNRNQSCWWLKPISAKVAKLVEKDNIIYLIMENQTLGDGYFNRKDLTKIGNFHTHSHLIPQED